MPVRALVIMMLCNVVWALNVVVSKVAIADLGTPPLFYALLRSIIIAVVLIPLLRPLPDKLWRVLLVGLAISGGSFALLFMGLATASPSAAGVVSLTGAPMTVLFAIIFLGERIRWRRGLGIGLAFGGVLFAMAGDNQMETSTGLLLVFISAVIGALGSVFVKRLDLPSIRLQAWAAVASVAVLIPFTVAMESNQIAALSQAPWKLAACLFFAAIVVSVCGHTAYYRLLQERCHWRAFDHRRSDSTRRCGHHCIAAERNIHPALSGQTKVLINRACASSRTCPARSLSGCRPVFHGSCGSSDPYRRCL